MLSGLKLIRLRPWLVATLTSLITSETESFKNLQKRAKRTHNNNKKNNPTLQKTVPLCGW